MTKMIAVFTTSVFDRTDADRIILFLLTQHKVKVTIDLQDEDKVMRIEGESFRKEDIIHHLDCLGFYCAELE